MEDPFEDFSRDPVRILERLGCVNGCFQVIPGGFLEDSWRISSNLSWPDVDDIFTGVYFQERETGEEAGLEAGGILEDIFSHDDVKKKDGGKKKKKRKPILRVLSTSFDTGSNNKQSLITLATARMTSSTGI